MQKIAQELVNLPNLLKSCPLSPPDNQLLDRGVALLHEIVIQHTAYVLTAETADLKQQQMSSKGQ